ncbi:NUDIX hydrolase [Novosphingobium sp. BL-8A]|uniref:NUDIX hydrolase n=1 Tax=Novosphingobium sp. BL-8A TaxID=3127639 RepID=UPI0037568605
MPDHHPQPILTVDIVPLTIKDARLHVLLSRRANQPFAGQAALIGGYVHVDKDASLGETARRVLATKAGLSSLYIEQLSTFSGPGRDPRGWSASVAYFSVTPLDALEPALGHEGLVLEDALQTTGLPFDHDLILSAAINRLRGKGAYSDLPARFLSETFTLAELHRTYQVVLDESINIDAFRRKVVDRDFLEATGEKRRDEGATRPSELYRLKAKAAVFQRSF